MLNLVKSLKNNMAIMMFVVAPSAFANNVIDILVVYTNGVTEAYGGDPITRINHLFQVTNQIYVDSGVELEIRVAGRLQVDYTDHNPAEEALHDITFNRHPALSAVAAAREQANADMVIFYRPYQTIHGSCGLAWVGGVDSQGDFSDPTLKDFMYAHIAFDGCGDFMTAHELGHNMGLRHSHKQDGNGGTFPYALGHGEVNKFATIMAYQSAFNADYWEGKVYKFSSPSLNCKGSPCGIDRTDEVNGADAVYALSVTAPQIAGYFSAQSSASGATSSVAASAINNKSTSSMSSISVSSSSSLALMSSQAATNQKQGGSGGGAFMLGWLWLLLLLAFSRR